MNSVQEARRRRARTHRIVPLRAATASAALPLVAEVRAAGDVPLVGDPRLPDAPWREIVDLAASVTPTSDIAWAAMTSGSGGTPRIVLRSEESWARSFSAVEALLDARPGDGVALPAPPASSLTLFSVAHALAGGPAPTPLAGAALLHGTPQHLRSALDDPPTVLRGALVGGSRLDDADRRRAVERGIDLVAYYGAAELSFVGYDTGEGLRPFPGVDLDVREGVLWVRSATVAAGYAGAEGPLRRDGAWATVGDRARVDRGELRLLGRADEAVLSASATIVPDEVEAVLRSLPGVRDAVVLGAPHPGLGQIVVAVLEPDHTVELHVGALRTAARGLLSVSHMPRRWHVGELPRTSSGKPARGLLAELIAAGEVPRCEP